MNAIQLDSVANNIINEIDRNDLTIKQILVVICSVVDTLDATVATSENIDRGNFIDTVFLLLKKNLKEKR